MERTEAAYARWVDFDEEQAWRDSEPETQLSPAPLFIDGMPHERGNPDADCCTTLDRCCVCGIGFVHKTGGYYGMIDVCDYCGA